MLCPCATQRGFCTQNSNQPQSDVSARDSAAINGQHPHGGPNSLYSGQRPNTSSPIGLGSGLNPGGLGAPENNTSSPNGLGSGLNPGGLGAPENPSEIVLNFSLNNEDEEPTDDVASQGIGAGSGKHNGKDPVEICLNFSLGTGDQAQP